MNKRLLWLLTVVVTITLYCTSCGKKIHLKVSKEEMYFTSVGGSEIVSIDADCNWVVDINEHIDWVHATPINGKGNGVVKIDIDPNISLDDRSTVITRASENGKIQNNIKISQEKVVITHIHNKFWYLYEYERWATDYKDDYIDDSYEHWDYYIDESYDNWFFYFMEDSTGYQIHTKHGDTIYYAYDYIYYPLGDSLYINFRVDTNVVEDYHATIRLLTTDRFQFSDEFYPHRFEKLYLARVSDERKSLNINPKKVLKKEHGPIITVER